MIGLTTTWNRRRRARNRCASVIRREGKKRERAVWRVKEKKMLNGEAEEGRGYRMGGRNVLGTRRVSIKWLWPVRYGGSLPRRDMHTLGLSTHRVHHTRMHAACIHTFTHVSRETRRKSIYKGNIRRFALVVFRPAAIFEGEKLQNLQVRYFTISVWSIFISYLRESVFV